MSESLGSRIRLARERAGLSQEELAVKVGVSLRTVGNWERGGTVPASRLDRLRAVLPDLEEPPEESAPQLMTAITGGGLKITVSPAPGYDMADVIANMAAIMEATARVLDELDAKRGSSTGESGS